MRALRPSPGVRSPARPRRHVLTGLLALLGGPLRAQVAGHDTLPRSGPAARERHERPADDPVLVQVERIRRDLLDFGKVYRKAQGADRERLIRTAAPALEEIQGRVRQLLDAARQP